jgi:hypothetical protein
VSTTARTTTTTQIKADTFEDLNPGHVNNFDDDDGKFQSKSMIQLINLPYIITDNVIILLVVPNITSPKRLITRSLYSLYKSNI